MQLIKDTTEQIPYQVRRDEGAQKNHFPTARQIAYALARPMRLQALRMDHPSACASRHTRAGGDRRGRPGTRSRTFAMADRHDTRRSVASQAGAVASAGGIKSRRDFDFSRIPKRRRVRARNAATPRRSSVSLPPAAKGWPGRLCAHIVLARCSGGASKPARRVDWPGVATAPQPNGRPSRSAAKTA